SEGFSGNKCIAQPEFASLNSSFYFMQGVEI
ncbi:MAG: hypothetical protein ACI9LS_001788, partial [Flavobacteriales bacterium]